MGVVKEHSKTIDGITYTTKTFAAIAAGGQLAKFIAFVGSDSARILMGAGPEGFLELIQDPAIYAVLMVNIAEREAEKKNPLGTIRELLINTTAAECDVGADKPVKGNVHKFYDTHFAGDFVHLFKVWGWVANVNFIEPSLAKFSQSVAGADSKTPTA